MEKFVQFIKNFVIFFRISKKNVILLQKLQNAVIFTGAEIAAPEKVIGAPASLHRLLTQELLTHFLVSGWIDATNFFFSLIQIRLCKVQ